jgi:hypothetical protein
MRLNTHLRKPRDFSAGAAHEVTGVAACRVRDKLGGLESEMTKSQVAKSQSNPKDQAPKPKEELAFS